LFTNVSVDRVRFMVEALLTQQFDSLALVKVGFRELPTLDELGATTVYARRLELAVPRVEDAAQQPRELISDLGLTTAHLEQVGMFDYLAARVAYAVEPEPFIHELRVGLEQTSEQRLKSAEQDDWLAAVEAHAGIVQLPSLPYYAVDGGRRFSFDVSLVLPLGPAVIRGGVQRNAPELLTVFPYAQDATSMRIEVSGTFDDEEASEP
jgi:hypothetical protein